MTQQHYVSFEEFNAFKKMAEEKITEKMIEIDEKLENMTELMMDGFDMLRDKIEEHRN